MLLPFPLAGQTILLVTHRLQDAFTMATHRYDEAQGKMIALPDGQTNASTTFLVLHQGHVVFDGGTEALVSSQDPFLKDFLA